MAKPHAYSILGLGLMVGGCLATVVAAATLAGLAEGKERPIAALADADSPGEGR